MNVKQNCFLLVVVSLALVITNILGTMVSSVDGNFFDLWMQRPAYSGGYSQPGAFGGPYR